MRPTPGELHVWSYCDKISTKSPPREVGEPKRASGPPKRVSEKIKGVPSAPKRSPESLPEPLSPHGGARVSRLGQESCPRLYIYIERERDKEVYKLMCCNYVGMRVCVHDASLA